MAEQSTDISALLATDITVAATKLFGLKPDGTPGGVNMPTLDSVLAKGAASNKDMSTGNLIVAKHGGSPADNAGQSSLTIIGSGSQSSKLVLAQKWGPYYYSAEIVGITSNTGGSASQGLLFRTSLYSPSVPGALQTDRMEIDAVSGNVGIGKTSATEKLDVAGNMKASGSVSGTVFNPTSLRSRKTNINDFEGDALTQINALQLHTYHFKEHEDFEVEPAIFDQVEVEPGVFQKQMITLAVTEQREIAVTDQQLNVGVILDEVDNDLIADQERGVLNLNNIVFLQARAIQQLTARLEELEAK